MNACFLPHLDRGEKLTVVVGAHDHTHGSRHMDVKFYHIHPGYESKSLLNDIMLLQSAHPQPRCRVRAPFRHHTVHGSLPCGGHCSRLSHRRGPSSDDNALHSVFRLAS
ncbi:hypothetical protein cypCar_00049462 [Cyprinus carpio]|nr:hypothetical protein cypCar_00049462 [Cyprinus carpio]